MLTGLGVRGGPNSCRQPGLTGVAPCGRSGGWELIARGLGRGGADGESCGSVGRARCGQSRPRDNEEWSAMLGTWCAGSTGHRRSP
jgi:hypothetical protein